KNPSKPLNKDSSKNPGEPPVLYDAICSNCGKPTKTIFKPEEGRPVYCKSCLKKMKANHTEIKKENEEKITSEQNLKIENIPFHVTKKNKDEKQKRKEINLSELKKALEESLENKEEDKTLPAVKEEKDVNEKDENKKGVI